MKPQSHLLTALPIAMQVSALEPLHTLLLVSTATIFGAVMPDIPIVLEVLKEKSEGKKPFDFEKDPNFEKSIWFIMKDISHSPLLWIGALLFSFYYPLSHEMKLVGIGAGVGVLSHWIIDLLTHNGNEFVRSDQTLIWPIGYMFLSKPSGKLPKLGNILGGDGAGFDYRYNYKKGEDLSRTKPFETVWQISMIALALLLFFVLHF